MKAMKEIAAMSYNDLRREAKEMGLKLVRPTKEEILTAIENLRFEQKLEKDIKSAMDKTKQESAGLFDLPTPKAVEEAEKVTNEQPKAVAPLINPQGDEVALHTLEVGASYTYKTSRQVYTVVEKLATKIRIATKGAKWFVNKLDEKVYLV